MMLIGRSLIRPVSFIEVAVVIPKKTAGEIERKCGTSGFSVSIGNVEFVVRSGVLSIMSKNCGGLQRCPSV